MKDWNITIVYTDGRSSCTLNAKYENKTKALIGETERAEYWKEDILSITIVENVRRDQ